MGSVNAACINFRPPPEPIPEALAGVAPREVWRTRPTRRLVGHVVVEDYRLYGGGLDRKAHAVSLRDGTTIWSRGLSGPLSGGVIKVDTVIYTGTDRPDGRVYALRASDGRELWRRGTGPVVAPVALHGGTLIVPTGRGLVLGLDPRTGAQRWRTRAGVARTQPVPADSGSVIVSTLDSLIRLSTADGSVLARAAAPGPVVSAWVRQGELLVAGTADSQVVAVRPTSLERVWRVPVDAPVLTAPLVRGDTVIVATRRGTVYRILPAAPDSALAEALAELRWPVTAPPAYVDGCIVLGGADGVVRGLRPDGSEAWRLGVWRPVQLSPIPLDSGLVVLGGNGDLHRYVP